MLNGTLYYYHSFFKTYCRLIRSLAINLFLDCHPFIELLRTDLNSFLQSVLERDSLLDLSVFPDHSDNIHATS